MKLDFSKSSDGLIPAVVQDDATNQVLMVGWMNEAALTETARLRQVVFFSRSKQRLWRKGETSGNVLEVISIATDCDNDSLLIRARPIGPTCHTGNYSCFSESREDEIRSLLTLEKTIASRIVSGGEKSYVASLMKEGVNRVAQKVGEEGVEVAIAGVGSDTSQLVSEGADLLFHLTVLLQARGVTLGDVIRELQSRSK